MIKPCKLNESVFAITNTSCVYLLTCVWVFCFLKVQKFNLSPTLALNYTKATRSRVGYLINSRYDMIIFIYKSWCAKLADWLLSQALKSREGILLILKCCQLNLVYKSKVFNKYVAILKKTVKSSTLFLRTDESVLPSQLTLLTENSLANCHFSKKDILQIIRNPDSNKVHGHDMISIRVLKFSCDSICQSQEIIFKMRYLVQWILFSTDSKSLYMINLYAL